MFYAERIEDCKIAERGVFLSLEEFLPYRRAGWSGTEATDKAADAMIATEGAESDTANAEAHGRRDRTVQPLVGGY